MSTLLSWGLANAAGAALLALLAFAAGRFCRRPALVHSLWLLVLLKLVTPPLLSLPLPWLPEEDAPAAAAAPPAPPAEPAPPRAPDAAGFISAEGPAPPTLAELRTALAGQLGPEV